MRGGWTSGATSWREQASRRHASTTPGISRLSAAPYLYLIHTSTFVHLCHGIPGNAHATTLTFRGIIYGTASRLSMMIAYLVFCLSRIIGDSLMLRLSSIPSPSKQIWSSTREKSLNMVMEFPMTWWLYLSSSTNSLVAHLSTIWYTAPDAWSSAVCIAAQRSLRCVYHKLNVYGIKITSLNYITSVLFVFGSLRNFVIVLYRILRVETIGLFVRWRWDGHRSHTRLHVNDVYTVIISPNVLCGRRKWL